MDLKYYRPENGNDAENIQPDWGIGGGQDSCGGITGGWGTDNNRPAVEDPRWKYNDLTTKYDITSLRITASGRLLVRPDGALTYCGQICPYIPALVAYIRGVDAARHAGCLLVKLVYTSQSGYRYKDVPTDVTGLVAISQGAGSACAYMGRLALPEPADNLSIWAKWQDGHYNHAEINLANFIIFGRSSGWLTVPMKQYTRIATVTVDEKYTIKVDNQPAKLSGNRGLIDANN